MNSLREEGASSSCEGDGSDDLGDSAGSGTGVDTVTSNTNSYTAIGKQETKAVLRQKLAVLMVLMVSAIATSVSVYFYVTNSEEEQFKLKFDDDAHKLLEAVGISFDRLFGAMDSVSVTLVSYSHLANKTWPFVALPDFGHRMSKLLPLSDALFINVLPVVSPAELKAWEQYSSTNDKWINECVTLQDSWEGYYGSVDFDFDHVEHIHGDEGKIMYNISRIMLPTWQKFPIVPKTKYSYNFDVLSSKGNAAPISCMETMKTIVSTPYMISKPGEAEHEVESKVLSKYLENLIRADEVPFEPVSDLWYPIIDSTNNIPSQEGIEEYLTTENKVVGVIGTTIYWRDTFTNVLPPDSNGIHIVISNPCSNSFTYQVMGEDAVYLGVGDLHDTKYSNDVVSNSLYDLEMFALRGTVYTGAEMSEEFCPITLALYPSSVMKKTFSTNNGTFFAGAAVSIFAFTSLVFYLYDIKVEQRQKHVLSSAVRSSAIVSSLFPSSVRDRLFPTAEEPARNKFDALIPETAKGKLQSFLRDGKSSMSTTTDNSAPIAELYPETTVLFADIAGFTAWSSERQPTQVFHLLETVYAAFDKIAKRRGVFKVETIGDSYVAVVGLPTPRKHHAVVMTRFANDCRIKMNELTHDLDKVLGPGTADLSMRFGLNSGPTTAGVLRGEKSRFQLFGDTVNTAARMESNGERNRIQVSQKTAELLKEAGKDHWLTPRKDKVDCKGKGMMSTFWCNPNANVASGSLASQSNEFSVEDEDKSIFADSAPTNVVSRLDRLIDWNFDLFRGLLRDVLAHRAETTKQITSFVNILPKQNLSTGMPVSEVKEVLSLSQPKTTSCKSGEVTEISSAASAQLHEFIASIAKMYRANVFHNFDHCSHVAMSSKKLLGRIAEHSLDQTEKSQCIKKSASAITSNPLTQFAIVFAALIHDVDHQGVTNAQLVEENSALAICYQGKSVAEQNSVDVAWRLLMESRFADLRACLFSTESELNLFRQVVINSVMATDLFDKDLKALRELRWQKSFHENIMLGRSLLTENDANRRATIVIVLIIQASDVSHTMQHFTVYKKWNRNLLIEMYDAYLNGRTSKNPLDGWYEGELWFFDNYIIPLARKLRECGVFGVACDELLDYANDNRMEWEVKGRDIVRSIAEELKSRTAQEPLSKCVVQEQGLPVTKASRYFL